MKIDYLNRNNPNIVKNIFVYFLFFLVPFFSFGQYDFSRINSKNNEIYPVLHPNGSELYFTRANDVGNIGGQKDEGDIWVSTLEGNVWSQPRHAGSTINNRFFNSVVGFSPDGKIMFLHRRYPTDDKPPKSQGLSYSMRSGDTWTFPKPVDIKYFKNTSDHQSGSLSADGKILLLAMNSFSSRGKEDIYVCFWNGNEFSQPQNLGSTINTSDQEMTPTLAPDNKTLFFSSNGHPGKGGRDIFRSERLDGSWTNWSKPINLEDINTEGVELSFLISPDMSWSIYTSTVNSDGFGDLNFYELPQDSVYEVAAVDSSTFQFETETPEEAVQPEKIFTGRVLNEKTRDYVSYTVKIRGGDYIDSLNITPPQRQFKFFVPDNLDRIYVDVKAYAYMPITETIRLGNSLNERVYYLKPLEVGMTMKLDKIYFERGQPTLVDSSYSELDKVVNVMTENPTMEIELAGHTDNQGDSQKNLELSQARVETVRNYLVSRGIAETRIKGKGYGGSRPIASNASEETRKLNRRVEFIITKF